MYFFPLDMYLVERRKPVGEQYARQYLAIYDRLIMMFKISTIC